MTPRPIRITRSDPRRLELEWENGEKTSLTTAELRSICPCAGCVDELSGRRRHDPATVPEDIRHSDVRLVGNYALSPHWADGHHTGFYPFALLRHHCPCERCVADRAANADPTS